MISWPKSYALTLFWVRIALRKELGMNELLDVHDAPADPACQPSGTAIDKQP